MPFGGKISEVMPEKRWKKKIGLRLSQVDLGYIAGIIDGEGTICRYRVKSRAKNPKNLFFYKWILRIGMTHKRTIAFVAKKLKRTFNHQGKTKAGNDVYGFSLTCRSLREFLPVIEPYLICKRRQAREAIRSGEI